MKLVNASQVEQCFAGHTLWPAGEVRDLPDEVAAVLLRNVNIRAAVEEKSKTQEKEK